MFTGIVQAVGTIKQNESRFVVDGRLPYEVPIGGSIAVDGVCLTRVDGEGLSFDLSAETLSKTNLGSKRAGDAVNLEAALRVGDQLGGHFVMGHVDGLATLIEREDSANQSVFRFQAPNGGEELIADKGSIALDGIALTTVAPKGLLFEVHLVPHTLNATTFADIKQGGQVNCEFDLVARYVRLVNR
jgi:riboflavin synthase